MFNYSFQQLLPVPSSYSGPLLTSCLVKHCEELPACVICISLLQYCKYEDDCIIREVEYDVFLVKMCAPWEAGCVCS